MAARIQWFSVLSVAILLTTSLWQIIYLRYYFKSKKLLYPALTFTCTLLQQ